MNAVQPTVARGLLRSLAGFRGYPRGEGETRFVDVLCEISLSVEHAAAILLCFDGEFPTIRELRDAALNLRPKYERKPDQRAEWEAKYGKPDVAWSEKISQEAAANVPFVDPVARKRQHAEEKRAMRWQAIRDSIYYTETSEGRMDLSGIDDKKERIAAFDFWREAAKRNQRDYPNECAAFRVELASAGWDKLMGYDWARGSFPPVSRKVTDGGAVAVLEKPITQSDIDTELRKAGRQPGDDE